MRFRTYVPPWRPPLAQRLPWCGSKQPYKRKRSGTRRAASRRTAAYYLKRGESRVTAYAATRVGRGRRRAKAGGTSRIPR